VLADSPPERSTESGPTRDSVRKRRWLRFSVRTMMIAVLVAAVALSWPIRRANIQRRAVAALKKAPGKVYIAYDFEYDGNWRVKHNASPWAPAWLRRLLGDEFFQEVDTVAVQSPASDETMEILGEFPRLRLLHLRDCSGIVDGLVQLRGMRNLETLELCGPSITDAKLAILSEMKHLRVLELNDTSVTDAGLTHVAAQPALQSLMIRGREGRAARLAGPSVARVTDAGLVHLTGLHRLRLLEISTAPGITDLAPLDPSRNLPELRVLQLHDTGVTDAGLAPIAGNTALVSLNLRSARITDAGLAHLRGLTDLKNLLLDHTRISDAGLANLSGLSALNLLSIGSTDVTDAGLAHLKRITSLRRLWAHQSKITEAEAKRALPTVSLNR
jgi:hypothetical protein